MNRRASGRLGGLATAARYGRSYMRLIGKRGAATTWTRYVVVPVGQSGYAMVDRQTNKVIAVRGGSKP